jgi:hypothetical protein
MVFLSQFCYIIEEKIARGLRFKIFVSSCIKLAKLKT